MVAFLPVLLGLHQIVEAFVWWGLEDRYSEWVTNMATWAYLLFAFVALPILIPVLVRLAEPNAKLRRQSIIFIALGVFASAYLGTTMLLNGPVATRRDFFIEYSIGLRFAIVVVGLYVVATCGPLLISRSRSVVAFGAANALAVSVLTLLSNAGFASLWCLYAAVVSAAIALFLRRRSEPRHFNPTLVVNLRPN